MSYEDWLIELDERRIANLPLFYEEDPDDAYEAWRDEQAQIEDERLADMRAILEEFKK